MQEWLQIGSGSNTAESPSDDAESVTGPDSGDEDDRFNIEAPQVGSAEVLWMEVSLCVSLGQWNVYRKALPWHARITRFTTTLVLVQEQSRAQARLERGLGPFQLIRHNGMMVHCILYLHGHWQ